MDSERRPRSSAPHTSAGGRVMRFVRANGGWSHTFWIAARKIRRCGLRDAVRALLSHIHPGVSFPQQRYRRFLRLHEPEWIREMERPLPPGPVPRLAEFSPDSPLPSDAEWVVLKLPDDRLRPFSLDAIRRTIHEHPDAVALYTDCDILDFRGRRSSPDFKPSWSPDTLRSWFYTHGLAAFRRDWFARLPSPAPLSDATIYRLWLRFANLWLALPAASRPPIVRIPGILLHRIAPFPAPEQNGQPQTKPDSPERRSELGTWNLELPETPRVSVIIPSRDHADDLRACLDSIRLRSTYPDTEIVIVDNGSTDPATLALLRDSALRVVRDPAPFNFSRLCNAGVRTASGSVLLFLNNDTEILSPDWLQRMLAFALQPHVGAVGARLLYPDGTLQHSGVAKVGDGPTHVFSQMSENTPNPRVQFPGNWSAVTGACLMVERRKFDEVGGFDETYPVAFNDTDLCFRLLEAGYFNVLEPCARLLHKEFATRGSDRQDPARRAAMFDALRRLYERHPALRDDPGYNPNLSTDLPDFGPQN